MGKPFPKQKPIVFDGSLAGNPRISTIMHNPVEQGYMAGCLAGLVTRSGMKGATTELKVGDIAA